MARLLVVCLLFFFIHTSVQAGPSKKTLRGVVTGISSGTGWKTAIVTTSSMETFLVKVPPSTRVELGSNWPPKPSTWAPLQDKEWRSLIARHARERKEMEWWLSDTLARARREEIFEDWTAHQLYEWWLDKVVREYVTNLYVRQAVEVRNLLAKHVSERSAVRGKRRFEKLEKEMPEE